MNDKISSILHLILALFLCSLVSFGVYLAATPFIYGVWHCPPPRICDAPAWAEYSVFLILSSPLAIFAAGAYLSRRAVIALTEIKFLRALLFLGFALFPLFVLAALIVYIINSP